MQAGIIRFADMVSLLPPIAEAEFEKLDAEGIAATEALGEIAGRMALFGARHAKIELAEEMRRRVLGAKQRRLSFRKSPALDVPERYGRVAGRILEAGGRRADLDAVEQIPMAIIDEIVHLAARRLSKDRLAHGRRQRPDRRGGLIVNNRRASGAG